MPYLQFTHDKHDHNPFCFECWSSIKRYTGRACSTCGLPIPSAVTCLCGGHLRKNPPFSRILCYGIYEGGLKELIHLLKCKGIIRIVKPLDYLLLELRPKIMTSLYLVPLHPKKLKEREFNHYREVPNLCHFSRSSPPCWWTTFYYRCDCK